MTVANEGVVGRGSSSTGGARSVPKQLEGRLRDKLLGPGERTGPHARARRKGRSQSATVYKQLVCGPMRSHEQRAVGGAGPAQTKPPRPHLRG